jgi:hypothetical protein
MSLTRKEILSRLKLPVVAERISEATSIDFQCDFEAIKFGDESFKTAHFGYIDNDRTKEMVSVWTDNSTQNWSIKVTGPAAEYGREFAFKDGSLMQYTHIGAREQAEATCHDDIPDGFMKIVSAAKDRGLGSFHFEPETLTQSLSR